MTNLNVPKKLIKAIQQAGSERKFARSNGVNILYVSQLLRSGIEPTDKTEKGRAARVKLYLPKKVSQPRLSKREWLPGEWQMKRRIGKMAKQTEQDVLRKK